MNTDHKIIPMFPTGVYRANIPVITDEQLDEINSLKIRVNEGNTHSLNTYCLSSDRFSELSEHINYHLSNYVSQMFDPAKDISLYVTQSWFNWTGNKEHHHRHIHTNSIISGVYYVRTFPKDNITFYRETMSPGAEMIHVGHNIGVKIKSYNEFTTPSMSLNVKDGDLLLFPSMQQHGVSKRKDNSVRISLAFNTFIKGDMGNEVWLNELKL